ncbi:hypothetical protein HanXRQr2_Chr03g0120241 [Helianthus annuus]|uniref:Uncharacterized protein n=1 Tax=Helianthus annuus TaxID=4232 RepID=A0A9K3JII1_HELAN|nr:hypothetical protein HanXRQr2_Chr03g0120241 [Helianthus annuus]KAJ0944439.1 hypothetical protein HanPSC8_Chr03g0116771 [Helianthus annuus]
MCSMQPESIIQSSPWFALSVMLGCDLFLYVFHFPARWYKRAWYCSMFKPRMGLSLGKIQHRLLRACCFEDRSLTETTISFWNTSLKSNSFDFLPPGMVCVACILPFFRAANCLS